MQSTARQSSEAIEQLSQIMGLGAHSSDCEEGMGEVEMRGGGGGGWKHVRRWVIMERKHTFKNPILHQY